MKKKMEFSKFLLLQESILVWITTLVCLFYGYLCISRGYLGSLPWITSIISACYAAYAVSQAFYYKKAERENTKNGIKYETALKEYQNLEDCCNIEFDDNIGLDFMPDQTVQTMQNFYQAGNNPDEYQI